MDESEDASSEVFLRAHRSIDSYDPAQPFRRWLLSIAAHHCVDRLRRRARERRLFSSADLDPEQFAAAGPSPLRQRLDAEARRELLDAISGLPDHFRAPLVLRYFADFSYDAISEVLGVTRNQVATLLFRGKRHLRERLATATPGDEPR